MEWLLERAPVFLKQVAHGRPVTTELDVKWERVVLKGVPMYEVWDPLVRDKGAGLVEEMGRADPRLRDSIRAVRVLRAEEELWEMWRQDRKGAVRRKERVVSVMVIGESVGQVLDEGGMVHLWGRRCQMVRYQRRVKGTVRGSVGLAQE